MNLQYSVQSDLGHTIMTIHIPVSVHIYCISEPIGAALINHAWSGVIYKENCSVKYNIKYSEIGYELVSKLG